jgi:hypothetical protein
VIFVIPSLPWIEFLDLTSDFANLLKRPLAPGDFLVKKPPLFARQPPPDDAMRSIALRSAFLIVP